MKLEELYKIAMQSDSKEHFLKIIAIISGVAPTEENIDKIKNIIVIEKKDKNYG